MENMVNIYLFGKQYTVPDNLTIMRAMEYAATVFAARARPFIASRASGS